MAKTTTLRRIAIYSNSPQETANRHFAGIHGYIKQVGGFLASDYCPRLYVGSELVLRPPWQGFAEGVVVCTGRDPGKTDKDMADWVLSGRVPAVVIGADWNDPRIPRFCASSASLAELAAEHLVECDCQSFLFLGFARSAGSPVRAKALRESLARRGKQLVEHEATTKCEGTAEDLVQLRTEAGLIAKLRKLKKPLAIWALNDNFAAAVCQLCQELQLSIPQQVKVLGVDDVSIARTQQPFLSSIRTPGEQVGRLAMQTLHRMLDHRRVSRSPTQVDAVELVGRTSTLGKTTIRGSLEDAQYYIARHACAGLTVDHLAQWMDVSRRTFELQFRDFVGHSPRDEIQRVRLERAQDLLRYSLFSVSRIGAMVGFQETAAFSKFFRNQAGISPREFRDQAAAKAKRKR